MKKFRLAVLVALALAVVGMLYASDTAARLPVFTVGAVMALAMWAAGAVGIYMMKLHSDVIYLEDRRQSLNFARPLFETRRGKVLGSISVWGFSGFDHLLSYGDRRFLVTREGLEPRPMAKNSRILVARGPPVAIDDRTLDGSFPAARGGINHHPQSKYVPKKAGRGRLFSILLSPAESDVSALSTLRETFVRAGQVAVFRSIAEDPGVADLVRKAGRRGRMAKFMEGRDSDAQSEIETERTKETMSE